uniref:GAE domain-containing protein n=1 Tax=Macrostomum lignano TaxID=282301 RepID=A0A1I8FEC1_9PLAT
IDNPEIRDIFFTCTNPLPDFRPDSRGAAVAADFQFENRCQFKCSWSDCRRRLNGRRPTAPRRICRGTAAVTSPQPPRRRRGRRRPDRRASDLNSSWTASSTRIWENVVNSFAEYAESDAVGAAAGAAPATISADCVLAGVWNYFMEKLRESDPEPDSENDSSPIVRLGLQARRWAEAKRRVLKQRDDYNRCWEEKLEAQQQAQDESCNVDEPAATVTLLASASVSPSTSVTQALIVSAADQQQQPPPPVQLPPSSSSSSSLSEPHPPGSVRQNLEAVQSVLSSAAAALDIEHAATAASTAAAAQSSLVVGLSPAGVASLPAVAIATMPPSLPNSMPAAGSGRLPAAALTIVVDAATAAALNGSGGTSGAGGGSGGRGNLSIIQEVDNAPKSPMQAIVAAPPPTPHNSLGRRRDKRPNVEDASAEIDAAAADAAADAEVLASSTTAELLLPAGRNGERPLRLPLPDLAAGRCVLLCPCGGDGRRVLVASCRSGPDATLGEVLALLQTAAAAAASTGTDAAGNGVAATATATGQAIRARHNLDRCHTPPSSPTSE